MLSFRGLRQRMAHFAVELLDLPGKSCQHRGALATAQASCYLKGKALPIRCEKRWRGNNLCVWRFCPVILKLARCNLFAIQHPLDEAQLRNEERSGNNQQSTDKGGYHGTSQSGSV